jgi:Fic family protein
MNRGLGKLQRKILQYADEKASNVDPSKLMTAHPYFCSDEVAKVLGVSTENAIRAIRSLERRGLLRVFPNRRERGISFGSIKLPELNELPSIYGI